MPFIALLDANVLFSAPLRDLFLRAAERGLYQPIWSEKILEETAGAIARRYTQVAPEQIEHLVGELRDNFPEAIVAGYESLIPAMTNAPEDRHVLAAAIKGGAQAIVTSNVSDFPSSSCSPYSIGIQTPDEFARHTWSLSPYIMADVIREQARFLSNPPHTTDELLDKLARSVPEFVKTVRLSRLI